MPFENSLTGLYPTHEQTIINNTLNITFDRNHADTLFLIGGSNNVSVKNPGTMAVNIYLACPYPQAPGTNTLCYHFPSLTMQGNPNSFQRVGKENPSLSFVVNGEFFEPGETYTI